MTEAASSNSELKDKQLIVLAEGITSAFYKLQNLIGRYEGQQEILDLQKPALITTLMNYKTMPANAQQIFDRVNAVNGIIQAIKKSMETLSAEAAYTDFKNQLDALEMSIDAYFKATATI